MAKKNPLPEPAMRRLRVYAFDPDASLDLGSAKFNVATISLVWNDPNERPLQPGPINEYLEVIDIDPVSGQFYEPLDLSERQVLAQDGLPPSEGDPRFHQQMVFAVAMKTIRQFERALGRKVLWAPRWDLRFKTYRPTYRLRIYPHALREENAYYARKQRALLFGYFQSTKRRTGANWVFTALSHDIIVHETTHAILDGLHPRYSEATSIDSMAFHEAFADITALFSHFQLEEAVLHYIGRNGGKLDQQSLLSGLASQFAKGTSDRAQLRDYLNKDIGPDSLADATEAHDRGAILVAAVFDAFLTIYSARIGDLLRIANVTPGEGGYLHHDLIRRLTQEAMKSADHVLRMCIRALDYLPPVDVRFGDFLRALITADADLIPDDRMNYRLAFIEAFRRRGIYPDGCLSLSPENLLWPTAPIGEDGSEVLKVDDVQNQGLDLVPIYNRRQIFKQAEWNRKKVWYWIAEPELKRVLPGLDANNREHRDALRDAQRELSQLLSRMRVAMVEETIKTQADRDAFVEANRAALSAIGLEEAQILELAAILDCDPKDDLPEENDERQRARNKRSGDGFRRWKQLFEVIRAAPGIADDPETGCAWEDELGIYFKLHEHCHGKTGATTPLLHTIRHRKSHRASGEIELDATVEVSSVRTTRRSGPDGQDIRQLVIEVTQRRAGFLSEAAQAKADADPDFDMSKQDYDFTFRGGATLIVDLRDNKVRYVISKAIDDEQRLAEQRDFTQAAADSGFTYTRNQSREPFALLHRH